MSFKFLTQIFFVSVLVFSNALALTDPEPNPFSDLAEGEQAFEAEVLEASEEVLLVKNSEDEEFAGRMEAVFKYRDGAGPAATNEFFVGDQVRVLVNSEKVIIAAQNKELLLCDQNFYGWVRTPNENYFTLETIEGDRFEVNVGNSTQFRDEDSKKLFGYSPRKDDVIRIHGVVNSNVKKIFTETFGAYISILSEEALQPFLEKVEKRKLEEATKLTEELKRQIFYDVPPENIFFSAINFIANKGIVNGDGKGNFRPESEINRAEFTKILVKTKFEEELKSFELTESCFPDFETSAWFAKFVCFAKENEILKGYPDGEFKPANPVNLAEAITILVKSFGLSVAESSDGEWFTPFIEKATELKILPENFAETDDQITRGQMSELIMRGIDVVGSL